MLHCGVLAGTVGLLAVEHRLWTRVPNFNGLAGSFWHVAAQGYCTLTIHARIYSNGLRPNVASLIPPPNAYASCFQQYSNRPQSGALELATCIMNWTCEPRVLNTSTQGPVPPS